MYMEVYSLTILYQIPVVGKASSIKNAPILDHVSVSFIDDPIPNSRFEVRHRQRNLLN